MNLMHFWKTPVWEMPGEPASDGNPSVTPSPAPTTAEPTTHETQPEASDYSWMPEQFRSGDAPDFNAFREHYDGIVAAQAIRDEALAEVPEDGKYEWAIPEMDYGELPLPADFAVNLKTDDPAISPLFDELGAFMKAHNMPKAAASDMMKLLAKYEAAQFSQFYQQNEASKKEMGTSFDSRSAEVARLLDARLPADLAAVIKPLTKSGGGVRALEKLLGPRGMTPPATVPQAASKNDLDDYYSKPTRK